ncbi:MAG: hypothetical protein V2J12_08135 [Gammaproteobacteria bacterium]|nr:hypothetical protein [Gammaproteobacteria bacterium]
MRKTLTVVSAVAAATLVSGGAAAAPIFDVFGPLPEATFGGTGIPNDAVAVSSQFVDGDTTITVALSATQRLFNPALTNDGAGTYFAQAGSNLGGPGSTSALEGALWNVNYYIDVDDPGATARLTDYDINIYYDFDPAFDNGLAGLGSINVTSWLLAGPNPLATTTQGSENLLFDFLGVAVPGIVTPPTFPAFDPNALGEYNFAITVARNGFPVETVAMDVQVVPVPAAAVLFPSALAMLGWMRRRRVS